MNCKPGDIARIVNSAFGNNDKLVRVIEPSPLNGKPVGTRAIIAGNPFRVKTPHASFCWVIEAIGSPIIKESGVGYRVCPASDSHLRPIRDPGDDAVDETLLRLPAPTKETA